jgi:hypothetical protein
LIPSCQDGLRPWQPDCLNERHIGVALVSFGMILAWHLTDASGPVTMKP